MLIITPEELAVMCANTERSSTLTLEGKKFSLGPTFASKMKSAAIGFCEQEESDGHACVLVEDLTGITVWRETQNVPEEVQPKVEKFDKNRFIKLCTVELTKCIGPMASLIMAESIESTESINPNQLIDRIVERIPDPKLAKEFKHNLKIVWRS